MVYLWLIFMANEGKYAIHGSYGNGPSESFLSMRDTFLAIFLMPIDLRLPCMKFRDIVGV